MPTSLPVRLNHDRLHDIETRASFEATDSFPIVLQNGDAPVHVHLHLDDALSTVASIPANNHFLDADSTREVGVEIADGPRPVEGRLKIVTGHGAETDYVTVSIVAPEDSEGSVSVDETLAVPNRGEGRASSDDATGESGDAEENGDAEESDENAGSRGAGFDPDLPDLPDRSDLSLGGNGPVVALALLAVAVAVGAATLSNSAVVLFGALVVLASVAAAAYLLVSGD